MEVTIQIPDELAVQAKARGVSVEAHIQEILTRSSDSSLQTQQQRTPEQIRAWLDSLAQFSDKIPAMPESISREWIYEDHN